MKSLKAQGHSLSDVHRQIDILEQPTKMIPFQQQLETMGLYPLQPSTLEIFQINVGKMCNQTCRHCHVDAGPDRKEIMSKATMLQCLQVLERNPQMHTVDITGGAPEMHPLFRWFVAEIKKLQRHVWVRCNLTILLAHKKYNDLPEFYSQHRVEIVSSLPFYTQERTDRQRGSGVFDTSIKALQMLNEAGYGKEETGLKLHLVYNPAGAFLPPSQVALQKEFKHILKEKYSIEFNELFAITNMPISRYLDYLLSSGNYEKYMQKLTAAFNPATVMGVMCRNTISIGWEGSLYDCDFNQMLELKVSCKGSQHLSGFNLRDLEHRNIIVGQHCYGCTAGAGSSCGGTTV